MGWTKTAPTKPGFYYWQGWRLSGDQVAVVQVSAYKDHERPVLAQEMCIGGYKNAPADAPAKEWGGIWAGPLPQPRDVETPSNAAMRREL